MKWAGIKKKLRWLAYLATEAYNAPYRGAVARAKREQDDLFMLL
ncbi:MAG TPA: DNA helicase, partial [Gemmatimonadetes bacterium]|nr:DNA helicase [Gemmatimonadota bacterium]